jgi:DNA mismatch endonuclease (patch repair protein)
LTDRLSPEQRSRNMARIRGKDTTPELVVRRLLHQLGYRYRLHEAKLPGSPDVVFPARRKVIFLHGCFWHRHPRCKYAYTPKSRIDFWMSKFERNVTRDARNQRALEGLGWETLVVWECEIHNLDVLRDRLVNFLGAPRASERGAAE